MRAPLKFRADGRGSRILERAQSLLEVPRRRENGDGTELAHFANDLPRGHRIMDAACRSLRPGRATRWLVPREDERPPGLGREQRARSGSRGRRGDRRDLSGQRTPYGARLALWTQDAPHARHFAPRTDASRSAVDRVADTSRVGSSRHRRPGTMISSPANARGASAMDELPGAGFRARSRDTRPAT